MRQCLCRPARVIEEQPLKPSKLPWELEEEILSRLQPHYLVRLKTVCKRWNSLFNDKFFLTKHLSRSRPQFIFQNHRCETFSVDIINHNIIEPTINLRELPASSDTDNIVPYKDTMNYTNTTTCDGFLFCKYEFWNQNGTALWNPWLSQVKFIEYEEYYEDKVFCISGFGYDSSRPQMVYKVLGYFSWKDQDQDDHQPRVAIYDCASHVFRIIDTSETAGRRNVSLNGNLYWICYTSDELFIRSFDFSMEIFKPFCILPTRENHFYDMSILAVYEGDRFSLLKQCCKNLKIDIWVTKKNIDREEKEVVWIKLMTLPTTQVPILCWKVNLISYFIHDKTLFMCCGGSQYDAACIYIEREDLCKKIQIGQYCHCVSTPSLIPLPLF
ncbi:hypothetical protein CARUB_v10015531mg [Capsella rubella]|uniref:F-box domain-containing protein n=1 Tax=Capsella rubella TaxID=81985 RepID=R0G9P3_9BRAS|nr:protein SUPPRESSOR OF NIM1 1 [Capsella rubella]EOA32271.1 hypothetical protein CARUB_v10015531mg [Capsella rubella]